ncbi:biotin synthase BioB [Calycomorphotria hydatis]|uniref:Biotin synthase n=1 Tax=Calycomorphotria hydatis TaxID=2528027 RepID=A0A517T9A7_9PLAN|nr:biotin synthase BioB [Calycomorphotria hydatis]QDT64961.1 Biotin synthase [Calycomorphotria hydatis]
MLAVTDGVRDWQALAEKVLGGEDLSRDDALAILAADDDQIPALVAACYPVRKQHFGKQVQLYYLKNAKSGLCPEDCNYCSQSKDSEAAIDKYVMLNEEKLLEGARQAAASQAKTYCIVASGRGPTNREVDHVAGVVRKIKDELGLHICCCLGILKPDQALKLRDAGVDRINHNLNTSRSHTEKIVTTHTYEDRLDTLRIAREAGMELCSGMIVGMGESHEDLVDVAFELRTLDVHSIPINFLIPIEGAPLGTPQELTPRDCLRALCLFRLTNPTSELRIAGGREVHLRSLQSMALYVANSMFVSDYLTTPGQAASEDFKIVQDLGFELVFADGSPDGPTAEGESSCTTTCCGDSA